MERPRGLIRLLLLAAAFVQANENHGRLHLTGCQPIEEFTELDQCHCNVGDRMSFSFNTTMLRGLNGPSPPSHLPLMFDHDLAGCDALINYTETVTTIDFVVGEECGVLLESGAAELPMLRTGSFNGRLLQAQLGFHYPNSQGQAEYVIAEVGCACPIPVSIDNEQSPCQFDIDQKLRFVQNVEIDCAKIKGIGHADPERCEILTPANNCFTVEETDDLSKTVKFDFALDDERCVGDNAIATKTGLGRYEKIDLEFEVKQFAPGIGRLGLQLPYNVDWNEQYVCQKSPLWSQWSSWSGCQGTCGAGKQFRSRICQNGLAGLPGCDRGPDGVTSVEEVTCQTNVECTPQCPGFTTLGDTERCECEEKPRLTVLVPQRLVPDDISLDNAFVYLVGSEPHATEIGNIASFNFLHHTGIYLLPYSPTISDANLNEIKTAIQNGKNVNLVDVSIGEASYDQIVLLRTFVPLDTYRLNSKQHDSFITLPKVFTSASVTKNFYDEDKFTFVYNINGFFATTREPFQITGPMTEGDWCRTTLEPDMPVASLPDETCEVESACDAFKPYRLKTDCVTDIRDDDDDECSEKCLEQCTDNDTLPPCRKMVNGQIIELEFTAYSCAECKIDQFTCDIGGPAQGVQRYLPADELETLFMTSTSHQQCQALLDTCDYCDDDSLPQWNEWGECDVKCGVGHRKRERDIFEVTTCKATLSDQFEVEECLGNGYTLATKVTTEPIASLTSVHSDVIVQCNNFMCTDQSVTRFYYDVDGICVYDDVAESCSDCCTAEQPTEFDWAAANCVSHSMCLSGEQTIVKSGPCPNHPFNEEFKRVCMTESESQCACPSDIDPFASESECKHLDMLHSQGQCRFFEELNDWRALAFACKPHSLSGRHCDGFVQCSPPECVDGEAKIDCCEPIDTEHLSQDNGDNCEQVVKFCYDDTGAKIDSACPDCSRNICEDPSDNNGGDDDDWHKLEWCDTEAELESCAASMGGELYCDGTLPSCEQQQERICSLTDDSGVFAKCRYNITCDCDAYHCTDNSITIEGVNEEFLDRLKPRTNDLKKIYGDNLNFYIGGGHPEAFRTEGCYHHYNTGMVDLTYNFGMIEDKCGVEIDGSRLNATIWVDSADHTNPTFATATPFAHVICHVTHDVKSLPEKNITSLMRFKPFEFIKVRKYEHDLSFDISTDPDFHELLEHRQLQNLVLVGDKMYARIRSNEPNNDNLKIKVVRCTVKKVNNQDLSLNFIENGCKNDAINEFDFTFGERGYENGAGSEVRFEWTNFVWRGFTNVEGDKDTAGREEQQYSCDVEICGNEDQECTPSCIESNRKRRSPVIPDTPASHVDDEEGVDFELEVFRTEAELKKRYQEILAEHINNTDAIDKLLSNAIVTLAAAMCFISAMIGFLALYKYFNKDKLDNGLQARIFRRFPPRGAPPKYTVSPKSFDPTTLTTADQATIDYAASTVDDFVIGQTNTNSV